MSPRFFAALEDPDLPDATPNFGTYAHTPAPPEKCGWCGEYNVGFEHLDPETGRWTCEGKTDSAPKFTGPHTPPQTSYGWWGGWAPG